jgi:hypothetical protein
MLDIVIDIVEIVNVSNTPLQIGVGPVDEERLVGTNVTPFDGSFLFDGEGLIKLMPGRNFTIEEYRVNLGQLQNYVDKKLAQVRLSKRLLSELTDIS